MSRTVRTRKVPVAHGAKTPHPEKPPPLTRSQIHELKRRVSDIEDRTRYMLVSVCSTKHVLYYDVSEDVFAMNAPSSGTLFKRQSAAIAIQYLLRNRVEIVRCRVNRRGRLIKSSIPRLRSSLLDSLGRRRNIKRRHA